MDFVRRVKDCGVIAIVRGLREQEIEPVAEALYAGAIGVGVGGNLVSRKWIDSGDLNR